MQQKMSDTVQKEHKYSEEEEEEDEERGSHLQISSLLLLHVQTLHPSHEHIHEKKTQKR